LAQANNLQTAEDIIAPFVLFFSWKQDVYRVPWQPSVDSLVSGLLVSVAHGGQPSGMIVAQDL
jgi:hypothetical protein